MFIAPSEPQRHQGWREGWWGVGLAPGGEGAQWSVARERGEFSVCVCVCVSVWGVCVCVCVCVGVWRWWARGFQTSPDTDRSLVSTTSNIPHPLLVSSFLSFPSSVQPSFFLSFPFLSSPLLSSSSYFFLNLVLFSYPLLYSSLLCYSTTFFSSLLTCPLLPLPYSLHLHSSLISQPLFFVSSFLPPSIRVLLMCFWPGTPPNCCHQREREREREGREEMPGVHEIKQLIF